MGRLFLLEFEQPGPDYYMCKACGTHIASLQELFTDDLEDEVELYCFFKAINVLADEPVHHRKMAAHTVTDIYCMKCFNKLGYKFVEVGEKDAAEALLAKDVVKLIKEKLTKSAPSDPGPSHSWVFED